MRDDLGGGVAVTVEVLIIGTRDGRLTYRAASTRLAGNTHPDACASGLAADATSSQDSLLLSILHSTSWRYTTAGVTLTYVAVPANGGDDRAAAVLPEHGIAHSGDPTRPSPSHVCPDAVATHAARHLAWLRQHDEVAATALAGRPELWHALDRYDPGPAGSTGPVVLDGPLPARCLI